MTQPIPGIPEAWQGILRRDNCIPAFTRTVDEIMTRTHIGGNWHEWNTDAALIRITRSELRQALEDAYDPTMPNWPAMVEIEDA